MSTYPTPGTWFHIHKPLPRSCFLSQIAAEAWGWGWWYSVLRSSTTLVAQLELDPVFVRSPGLVCSVNLENTVF